jgi:molybdate transport system ATP-binding protein
MLDRFDLSELAARFPRQISGGQQQRVALARALARRPRLLLLDEPLSALDESLREELRNALRNLLSDFAIPVVLVTHDRAEAMKLADLIVILWQGNVLQTGSVADVFERPVDDRVAQIVGKTTADI